MIIRSSGNLLLPSWPHSLLLPLAGSCCGVGISTFAPQPHLDRLGHVAGVPHADVGTAQRWRDALPGLVDVYLMRPPWPPRLHLR